jgi:hypothetical protein
MLQLENIMSRLDDSFEKLHDEDIHAVLTMVPWARESVLTYLTVHRTDFEKEILARIEEMLGD